MRALRILLLALLVTIIATFGGPLTAGADWGDDDDDESETDGETDYARTGAYVSVSGVFVAESWPGSNRDAGAEDTHGINLRAGLRVNQWASAEVELELIDDFFPDERQDYQLVTFSANTRVYPFGGRVQPYALGGLGVVASVVDHRDRDSSVTQSNADWNFRAGAGIDFYYTDHVALTFEGTYVWTVGDVKDIDHVSVGLGLLYRF